MTTIMLKKIISGGQTGVDRAALDAALENNFPCGGYCPSDRAAEDGEIPARYPLVPLKTGGYRQRTIRNLEEADGTLIIYFGDISGGTALTLKECLRRGKPFKLVDGSEIAIERAVELVSAWVRRLQIMTLNVAGPRASTAEPAKDYTSALIRGVLALEGNGG